jgi:hypothetical protein
MRKHRVTKEEKIAKTIIESVNDFTLDLDAVGRYVGEQAPVILYNRLDTVIDSARYTKEEQNDRLNQNSIY